MTGPPARRIAARVAAVAPNADASTTTMISTHNHVDMAVSWWPRGRFAVALLPPTRASNSVTARQLPGPGGCVDHDHASAQWGRAPWGHYQPAQPQPCSTSTTRAEDPAGVNRPNTTTASPTGAGWRGRAAFAPAWVGNDADVVMLRRNGRRRAVGAGPMVRALAKRELAPRTAPPPSSLRYNPARAGDGRAGTGSR